MNHFISQDLKQTPVDGIKVLLKLMIGGSGTLYDPALIKAFAGIFR